MYGAMGCVGAWTLPIAPAEEVGLIPSADEPLGGVSKLPTLASGCWCVW